MKLIIWLLVLLLVVLHQDIWFWSSSQSVAYMPIGLTYHIGLSLAAAAVWAYACFFAWPEELQGYDETDVEPPSSSSSSSTKGA